MQQIIDGLKYDTEKADKIGDLDNGYYANDFNHWHGTLYRTKKRKHYFLAGRGGPMSMFARSCGNSTSGSTGIIVLDSCEALALCEDQLEPEVVEQFFKIDEA
jgi:hypothetical protein